MVLGVPVGKVRVVKPYVGGGFGIKAAANTGELAACLLARKTGKPVKPIYSREQVFMLCRARHQFVHHMTTGVKKDGTLLALQHECHLDGRLIQLRHRHGLLFRESAGRSLQAAQHEV